MPSYESGQKITHKLSRRHYYYMGVHPHSTALHVISPEDGLSAYTIPTKELTQYYELAVDDVTLETNCSYLSQFGRLTEVVAIHRNPQSGDAVAFAWITSDTGYQFPRLIEERFFKNYTKI